MASPHGFTPPPSNKQTVKQTVSFLSGPQDPRTCCASICTPNPLWHARLYHSEAGQFDFGQISRMARNEDKRAVFDPRWR